MKFAYFPGCKIPHHLPRYGEETMAVCRALGLELIPLEFNCCGWPLRDQSHAASMFSAARNLALAGRAGLSILTPCKCCFGQLKQAGAVLIESAELAGEVKRLLALAGLKPASPEVWHLITALDRGVGAGVIESRVERPLEGLKVACHYGCHALRPSRVTGFDDPFDPTVFERLVRALGAEPVPWDLRLECCGYPLREKDPKMSRALMNAKLSSARAAGADVVATACTYCQMQFETARDMPAVLITSLISAALGLAEASGHGLAGAVKER